MLLAEQFSFRSWWFPLLCLHSLSNFFSIACALYNRWPHRVSTCPCILASSLSLTDLFTWTPDHHSCLPTRNLHLDGSSFLAPPTWTSQSRLSFLIQNLWSCSSHTHKLPSSLSHHHFLTPFPKERRRFIFPFSYCNSLCSSFSFLESCNSILSSFCSF